MPRYTRARARFPLKIKLQINDEYVTKLNRLQERLGFGPVDPGKASYRRARTIRACIDYTYAALFVSDSPPQAINNANGE